MTQCWSCASTIDLNNFARGDTCLNCRRDSRVCKNCEHYAPGMNNDCRENSAERVQDKERATFCDYFKATTQSQLGAKSTDPAQTARLAAEALFNKRK